MSPGRITQLMLISAAIYLTVGLDLSINLPASEHLPNHRMRRQAPQKCLDDIKELQQPDIQACENLLTNATEVKANQFCQNGCASKLHDIYQKIHTDCGAYYPQVLNICCARVGDCLRLRVSVFRILVHNFCVQTHGCL